MIYSYINDKNKLLLIVVVQFVVHNKVSLALKSKILSHNKHSEVYCPVVHASKPMHAY
jgi:hypothetical protein